MTYRSLRLLAIAAALTLLPAAAQAKKAVTSANAPAADTQFTAETAEIYKSVSIGLLEAACKQLGLDPKRDKDDAGDPCLVLDFDGIKAVLLFYGDAEECSSLALQASWAPDETTEMQVPNDWNRAHRFTRAYCTEKRYVLEADIDIADGVTSATLGRWVGQFKTATAKFAEHIKAKG